METAVRESVEGETEVFEDLLNRILTECPESEINWVQFLSFFSKKGKMHTYKQLVVSPRKGASGKVD